jgi:mannose-1-phosphate guanylyltransferase
MAGGRGTRFWPRSRKKKPKQLLDILSDRSMLQETLDRVLGLAPVERVLIITNREQAACVREQVPQVPASNIISEPVGRNTAACVCLAAGRIQRDDPGACMCVIPADHCIADRDRFRAVVLQAADVALCTDALVTIGIAPPWP